MKVTGKKDDQVSKLLQYDALHAEMLANTSYEEIEEKCDQRGLECSIDMIGTLSCCHFCVKFEVITSICINKHIASTLT